MTTLSIGNNLTASQPKGADMQVTLPQPVAGHTVLIHADEEPTCIKPLGITIGPGESIQLRVVTKEIQIARTQIAYKTNKWEQS